MLGSFQASSLLTIDRLVSSIVNIMEWRTQVYKYKNWDCDTRTRVVKPDKKDLYQVIFTNKTLSSGLDNHADIHWSVLFSYEIFIL